MRSTSGHCRQAGADVAVVEDLAALADANVAIVVNPNNPDGRLIAVGELLNLASQLNSRGGKLVVDEAFIDVLPRESSLAPHLPRAGVVILRSFGKTYGLAGLRLGFASFSLHRGPRCGAHLGPSGWRGNCSTGAC